MPEIVILRDRGALAGEAATRFISMARIAIRARERFAVALSGGSTPRDLYQLLATSEFSSQVEWPRVHLFWSDERVVPPDDPESNYKTANDALIAHVPIPASNVHRIRAELPPDDSAREYEQALRASIQRGVIAQSKDGLPRFDLTLLGLGADAHTASLFPHTSVLRETVRWVAAPYVDKLKTYRITFTPPLINASENILFLGAGTDKAAAVHTVLRGEHRPQDFPAQLIQPTHGKLVWLLDEAAGEQLKL